MVPRRPQVPAALRGGNRMNVVEHTIECSGSAEGIAVVHAIDELNAPMQVAHVLLSKIIVSFPTNNKKGVQPFVAC
jgi:hypothetical protein